MKRIRNRPPPDDIWEQIAKHDSVYALTKHYSFNQVPRWFDEIGFGGYEKQNLFQEEKIGVEFLKDVVSSSKTFSEVREKVKKECNLTYAKHEFKIMCKRCGIDVSHLQENELYIPSREEILAVIGDKPINKAAIARHFGVEHHQAMIYLKKHGIEADSYSGRKIYLDDRKKEEFIKDSETLTRTDLVRKYKITLPGIKGLAKRYGVDLIKRQDIRISNQEFADTHFEEIKELNKQGYNYNEIAAKYNMDVHYIKETCVKNNYVPNIHSYNKSKGELEVRDYIRSIGFECVSKKPIFEGDRLEIDCYVEIKKFGLEYCGEYFHSEDNKTANYHQKKTFWAKKQNINLITIFEHEWLTKKDIIKSMIKARLGITETKIYARQCEIKIVDSATSRAFHDKNHLQEYYTSEINIGLFYKNEIKSVMSFSKSRFNKNFEYEIIRFSNELNCNIVGGASKLFKFFIKNYNPISIISYADLRYSQGNLYEKLGMTYLTTSSPNYWYYKIYGGIKLESRQKFQKHKLASILPNFDPNKTEKENMRNNRYFIIYDCGTVSFGWKKDA